MIRSSFFALAALTVPLSLGIALAAQAPTPPEPVSASRVEVPTFPNATCPIMGKRVSLPLFVDTEVGRFYVCCKPCIKKILANVPEATKTGYPTTKEVANKVCPVSGEAIGEHAETVFLQGYSFQVCCAECTEQARADAQIVLTKLLREKIVDLGNTTCPVSGEPVARNAFTLIDNQLVHLASPKLVAAIAKEPDRVLAKAREIAAKQPPAPKHVPRPKQPPAEAKQPKDGK